uniref:helix-turn-helix domain-containing protein n=1 Tax=Phenylobacterium sp. TaxID=1871053 RepID=UPI00286B1CE8|nr:helix-turn-helix domain-containing protein [Phenylobacterium sp.]
MSDSIAVLDPFVRGIAAGAMAVTSMGVWRSRVSMRARVATVLLGVSTIAWLVTESWALGAAFGHLSIVAATAYPVGGIFWLFTATLFEDRPVTPLTLLPAAGLLALGLAMGIAPQAASGPLWTAFNLASGLFAVHAGYMIVRSWRGDLLEGRRRLRGLLFGLVAAFVVGQVTISFLSRLDPAGPWRPFMIGRPYGGAMLAALILAGAVLFLQARPEVFGAQRRRDPAADPRAEAADRLLVGRLDTFLAAEGWRREGLSIGTLAGELSVPEHRLRRLINNRLGHRNFADFLNASRIAAARRRLADPAEARTTVAAIAFDLGYGSLGPFNRAFRAATGATPTEWRRQALGETSPSLEQSV